MRITKFVYNCGLLSFPQQLLRFQLENELFSGNLRGLEDIVCEVGAASLQGNKNGAGGASPAKG
jgi:hypothetical protein